MRGDSIDDDQQISSIFTTSNCRYCREIDGLSNDKFKPLIKSEFYLWVNFHDIFKAQTLIINNEFPF